MQSKKACSAYPCDEASIYFTVSVSSLRGQGALSLTVFPPMGPSYEELRVQPNQHTKSTNSQTDGLAENIRGPLRRRIEEIGNNSLRGLQARGQSNKGGIHSCHHTTDRSSCRIYGTIWRRKYSYDPVTPIVIQGDMEPRGKKTRYRS
jgi:hypothetical protein